MLRPAPPAITDSARGPDSVPVVGKVYATAEMNDTAAKSGKTGGGSGGGGNEGLSGSGIELGKGQPIMTGATAEKGEVALKE